jgi:hypothetical protein
MAVLGVAMAAPWATRPAQAGVAKGLPLEDLVKRSAHVLRATPLEAYSEWSRFGKERRIVTYTRVRVDDPLGEGDSPEAEVLVRTLGGVVGDIGQVVHGEATLIIGEPCVAFLKTMQDGVLGVTAMAQGHYPLRPDPSGLFRLNSSPELAVLLDEQRSAVARLRGRTYDEAKALVRAAKP